MFWAVLLTRSLSCPEGILELGEQADRHVRHFSCFLHEGRECAQDSPQSWTKNNFDFGEGGWNEDCTYK